MATTTEILNKQDLAIHLRTEMVALENEVSKLREKQGHAEQALGVLQNKRRKLTEDAAHGKQHSPSEIADLTAALNHAQIPLDGLTSLLSTKQAALDTVRTSLETLQYELNIEAQRKARQDRFDALAKQGREVSSQIAEILGGLIEDKLSELGATFDALTNEFVNINGQLNAGPGNSEARAARALIAEIRRSFFDGSCLAIERRQIRAGWQVRGERENGLEFVVRSLRPPRK